MAEPTPQERIAQLELEVLRLKTQNQELQGEQGAKPQRKVGAWRLLSSNAFLVLGLLVLVPAGMLLWLDRTVVRPESYIASVGPVISEPAVQAAIQKSATDAIFSRVDVNEIVEQALPERSQLLAGPIATQVKTYTSNTIGTIVASEQFERVWVNTNTRAQAAFMKVAQNSSGDPSINLSDVYGFISEQLKTTRLAPLADKQLPANVGNIHVATVPALERIPHYVAILDTWKWVLLGIVVGLLALAVGLAPNRRKAFTRVGLGVIAAGIVTLVVVRITRAVMLDTIPDATYREAAVAVWQTVLNPFLIQILVMSILGLAIVLTAWLLGPGRAATRVRQQSQGWLASGRAAILPAAEDSAAIRFTRQHHGTLLWGVLGLTLVLLAVSVPLTIGSVVAILVAGVVLLLVLEFFAAPSVVAKPEPDQLKV